MVTEVYADLLFLINFSMDYLCLYICARVLRRKMSLPRMILAATIGGIHSIISLLFDTSDTLSVIIDICVCIIMCAIVFAEKKRAVSTTLLCSFLFLGISMMVGGAMTAVFNFLNRLDLPVDSIDEDGISPYLFALLAILSGVITIRSGDIMSRRSSIKICTLKITINKKEAVFQALSDSGNLAKDPLSGRAVIIVDKTDLSSIADIDTLDNFLKGKTSKNAPYDNIRVIPIKTAGGSSLLTAIFPDKITVEAYDVKRKKSLSANIDALVAPSDIGKTADGCNAVIPAELLKF